LREKFPVRKPVRKFFRKYEKKFPPFSGIFPGISPEVPRKFPRGNLGAFVLFRYVNECTRVVTPVDFGGKSPEIPGKFLGNFGKSFPHFFFEKKFPTKKFSGKLTNCDKIHLRNYEDHNGGLN
tara:strand:- start:3119 stop:3487 length:369 start_codon:yes stop_codon:yes gene_type:complete